MKKKLHDLKKKPHEERKKIATFAAGITTVCIVIIWLFLRFIVIPPTERNPIFDKQSLSDLIKKTTYSFDVLGDDLQQQKEHFDDVKQHIQEEGALLENNSSSPENSPLIDNSEDSIENTEE